jgi:glycosyltransferase involved in cell wall biosynthesis
MMNPPAISIVLPTYNGSRYIRTSIESCLNQTFQDFELIIVNDCSTDNTKEIIIEYAAKDSRVKLLHNAFNKKLPLSLNEGFNVAKGKYHTWTSDDNYYALNALETLFDTLEKDKSIDFVYTDYTIINDNDEVRAKRTFGDINEKLFQGCSACFLYKAEIYKANNGYNPSAFLIEDFDFFLRAFLQFKILYLTRYDLYYYREHASSLTSLQSDAVNDIAKIMMERQMSRLEQKLSAKQLALLFRKFAVFNAVQKNNGSKYKLYLEKLWKISKSQAVLTMAYVPALKFYQFVLFGVKSVVIFFRMLFK